MKVQKTMQEHETIIKLSGAIDTPVAQSFMDAVEECRSDRPHRIIFDFKEVLISAAQDLVLYCVQRRLEMRLAV